MVMTDQHRTCGRKTRLVVENGDNSSHRENDAPDEGSGLTSDWIWTAVVGLKKPAHFFFWGNLKSLMYESLMATVDDFTARIVVASVNIASTSDLFEGNRQLFVHRWRLYYVLHGRNIEQFL
ncbi:hypothetical protein TNCV_938071 [Trichonephila clavipes]|nr:hypothetical protein TNCV_938071 [Trichonephila clavipes]